MPTCFVMQPFDGDVFDKRFETVFAPGIRDAGLEPYRVDRDPAVGIPIESIETGIRSAQLCFADITTDNPNVWFELGFAIAACKDAVLVCSEERKTHFPFDVQHRSIIKYRTGAPQDFEALRQAITKRVIALLKKSAEIDRATSLSPVKNTDGLSQHEVVALVTVMENQFLTGAVLPAVIRRDMNRAGFTDIAATLAVKLLESKSMISLVDATDDEGLRYSGFLVSTLGQEWLLSNQERLVLRIKKEDSLKIAGPLGDPEPF